MQLLRQVNRWSCLPTALAMLADVSLEDVLDKIGHDGSEIIFPTLPEPLCRRSFTVEEIQYVTAAFSFVLVQYHPGVIYKPKEGCEKQILFPQFQLKLEEVDGLLFGTPNGKNLGHVVAWSAMEKMIYDPNGTKYPADCGYFVIETFYGKYAC